MDSDKVISEVIVRKFVGRREGLGQRSFCGVVDFAKNLFVRFGISDGEIDATMMNIQLK